MSVNIQIATKSDEVPSLEDIRRWAEHALCLRAEEMAMTVRVVGIEEGTELNERWRESTGPTNVLAFCIDDLEIFPPLLGDVIICAPVVNMEARRDGKIANAHWAHLIIHGTLHLLGYNHVDPIDAEKMEQIERELLRDLRYPDPYL